MVGGDRGRFLEYSREAQAITLESDSSEDEGDMTVLSTYLGRRAGGSGGRGEDRYGYKGEGGLGRGYNRVTTLLERISLGGEGEETSTILLRVENCI